MESCKSLQPNPDSSHQSHGQCELKLSLRETRHTNSLGSLICFVYSLFTFTFTHFADAFIQATYNWGLGLTIFVFFPSVSSRSVCCEENHHVVVFYSSFLSQPVLLPFFPFYPLTFSCLFVFWFPSNSRISCNGVTINTQKQSQSADEFLFLDN